MSKKGGIYDVVVIGAGAAGMIAAGKAAESGARTLLLEKKERPGRKLSITGKGRCNLTNASLMQTFMQHFGSGGKFLRSAFHRFSNQDLMVFFNKLGMPTVVERGERVFPSSQSAEDVVNTLTRWIKNKEVRLKTGVKVRQILTSNKQVIGVEYDRSKSWSEVCQAKTVIIATGGASYPATGSSGDGFELASSLGHQITQIYPGLVPLETNGDTALRLQGLTLRNVTVSVWIEQKKKYEAFGEILFTHFGLSGPVVLTLSPKIVKALLHKYTVSLCIDLKPALDKRKLENRLLRDIEKQGNQKMKNFLQGLLPKKLIPVCLEQTGISAEKIGNQLLVEERRKLRNWLKEFTFTIIGYRSFEEAIITVGGIKLDEVDPKTMGSKLISGLYLAGELLDIYADTGGYNLQAAFSTGWVAGKSAADFCLKKNLFP